MAKQTKSPTAVEKKIRKDAFTRLKKLLSIDVVAMPSKNNRIRVIDTAKRASSGSMTNVSNLSYWGRSLTSYDFSASSTTGERGTRYTSYARMDKDPIISSALDIYADESTMTNEVGDIIIVKTELSDVKSEIENLFNYVLTLKSNMWAWARTMCKYGDSFLFVELNETVGVTNIIPISAMDVYRVEEIQSENSNDGKSVPRTTTRYEILNNTNEMLRFKTLGRTNNFFEDYEIIHFRMLGDTEFLPYGKSILEGARLDWQKIQMMEDAMLIHRITRAPDKRVYKIEVGDASPNETSQLLQLARDYSKRVPHTDSDGNYNLRYAMDNLLEDLYVPMRGGREAAVVDTLPGLQYQAIEDIEYLQKKFMAALKIPKAFLGFEEDISGKATLASEDVRFARTIRRVQSNLIDGLTKIAQIHLLMKGYDIHDSVDFELEMISPSIVFQRETLELLRDKLSVAQEALSSGMLSREWVYKHVFDFSDDEMTESKENILKDALYKYRIYVMENEGKTIEEKEKDEETEGEDSDSGGDYAEMQNPASFGNDGGSGGGESESSKSSPLTTKFKGGTPLNLESFLFDAHNMLRNTKSLLTK